jgi:hypothetical protein
MSRFLASHEAARSHLQAVVSAQSAATLLVEGLRRAGREVSRRRFTEALEQLYRFETGLTPPVTFDANRRVGARGAYVLSPSDLSQGRLPDDVDWVETD